MTSIRILIALALCSIGLVLVSSVDYDINSIVCNSRNSKFDVSSLKVHTYDFTNNINSTYYINSKGSAGKVISAARCHRSYTHFFYVFGYNETIDDHNQKNVLKNMKHARHTYIYIFDHSYYTYATSSTDVASYVRSVSYYRSIGKAIALFIKDLIKLGVPLENCIVAGHSLGGQIAGAIGEVFIKATGTKIPRIIASDPAGPCFTNSSKLHQFRKGLAEHTEVYHCNKGVLGTTADLADAEYYINGGAIQPGCAAISSQASAIALCSHNTCPVVLTMPVRVEGIWTAKTCTSVSDCEKGVTQNTGLLDTIAGIYSPITNRGTYYVNTAGYNVEPL